MNFRFQLALALILFMATVGCRTGRDVEANRAWLEWQSKRFESVAGSNGWITLVARHWLNEEPATAGSSSTNKIVLPSERAPAVVGTFFRDGSVVRFESAPGITAMIEGRPVVTARLTSDASNSPTRLLVGSLTFIVIERGDRIGVRVRDAAAPARKQFRGIKYFPYGCRLPCGPAN